jgi:hypothetical protein
LKISNLKRIIDNSLSNVKKKFADSVAMIYDTYYYENFELDAGLLVKIIMN